MTPEDLIASLPPLGGVLREAWWAEDRKPLTTLGDCDNAAALAVAKVVVGHVLRELGKRSSPGAFIPWAGGACPVGAKTRVDVRYRGMQSTSSRWRHADDYLESGLAAGEYWWKHTDSDGDIVAYRVRSDE